MSLPLRPRAIPQCSACLRSYVGTSRPAAEASPSAVCRQQVRGKKMARPTGTIPVRLLKDLPGFGRRGAIIPVSTGEMRNKWFPRRVADYIPRDEQKALRANNVPMDRDYSFGRQVETSATSSADGALDESTFESAIEPPKPKAHAKLTSERSMQLLEIFVKPVLEFYRQPIIEEKPEESAPAPEPKRERQRTASSAAADLLAARMQPLPSKSSEPQAIYGSVSIHDILVHIRAAIATNDEAARVILTENDIRFMDKELQVEGKVKHVGDFTIEIAVKGEDVGLKRTVRIKPQAA